MTAASAASGTRAWLQSRGWLSPRRMRAITIALMCSAGIVSTIGFSGSTATAYHPAPPPEYHPAHPASR